MSPTGVLLLPALLQMLAMLADEGVCHRKRGLPLWERLGHPIDTLSVAACYGWLVASSPGSRALAIYIGLAAFSCLLVTKDEFVHARVCGALESWLHAILFVLHPIVFLAFGFIWWSRLDGWVVRAQLAATLMFCVYQLLYWNWSALWNRMARKQTASAP
jgi:hypothetical protein